MPSVRVSCQTIALAYGRPLRGSQTTVVSRWLVMPTAASSRAGTLASASVPAITAQAFSQISVRVVLHPPGAGVELPMLQLPPGHLVALPVEQQEARAGRALVQGPDVSAHGLTPATIAQEGAAAQGAARAGCSGDLLKMLKKLQLSLTERLKC